MNGFGGFGQRPQREVVVVKDFQIRKAPWLQYPEYPAGHIAWRMGSSEGYLRDWITGFIERSRVQREAALRAAFPIPQDWIALAAELLVYPSEDDDDWGEAYEWISKRNTR